MKQFDTVLFDLDGTLLDTLPDLAAALNAALSQFGYPARSLPEVQAFVGNGLGMLVRRALPQGEPEERQREVLAALKAYYAKHLTDFTRPYDGVLPLLAALRERGFSIGIVSNKADSALQAVSAHFFGGLVDGALGEQEALPRKPAPDMVNRMLAQLGKSASRCLYVGDSDVDVQTAKNANLTGLFVTWGFRSRAQLEAAGATALFDSADALAREIFRLAEGQ